MRRPEPGPLQWSRCSARPALVSRGADRHRSVTCLLSRSPGPTKTRPGRRGPSRALRSTADRVGRLWLPPRPRANASLGRRAGSGTRFRSRGDGDHGGTRAGGHGRCRPSVGARRVYRAPRASLGATSAPTVEGVRLVLEIRAGARAPDPACSPRPSARDAGDLRRASSRGGGGGEQLLDPERVAKTAHVDDEPRRDTGQLLSRVERHGSLIVIGEGPRCLAGLVRRLVRGGRHRWCAAEPPGRAWVVCRPVAACGESGG